MVSLLQINELGVDIKGTRILQNITCSAAGRNIMAVMGPSGSGKTTLLNAIAGRQSISAGSVTLDGQPLTKLLRRRLGVVLQEDVFFPSLTLWETLYFTAMIRLPESMPTQDKMARLNDILQQLDIQSCANTVFGDIFSRGLSGGEKKRASIACELLTDPDILLLDEPTSGLDSSLALTLVRQLKQLAVRHNKTVIASIHQPSSQLYYNFDTLLLLAQGRVAYFGFAQDHPLDYFQTLGYTCEPHYNRADFLIELVKEDKKSVDKLVNSFTGTARQELLDAVTTRSGQQNGTAITCQARHNNAGFDKLSVTDKSLKGCVSSPVNRTEHVSATEVSCYLADVDSDDPRWPTGFMTQFRMLTWRNFKIARGSILHLYDVIHALFICALCALVFYRVPNHADVLRDKMGLVFFCVIFWIIRPAIQSVITVATERAVIAKERSSGAYRLSAYFLAKNVSEMTVTLILPTCFYTITYWVARVNGVSAFFMSLAVLLLATLTGQGIGILIGAAIHDVKLAIVSATTTLLVSLLAGGFITQEFPQWLEWFKYVSVIHHVMSAMTILTFAGADDVPCNATSVVTFPKCLLNSTDYVTSDEVLHEAGITLPIYCYISTTAIICVLVRVLAYYTFRVKRNVLKY